MQPNNQTAPYPHELSDLVDELQYRPGWTFDLSEVQRGQGSEGLTLTITTRGYDTYHPDRGEFYGVHHYFPVPPAAYNRASWLRWLFEQFQLVERHECMEFFQIGADRPFKPNHGPGEDPYVIRELTTEQARRTSFRGTLNPSDAEILRTVLHDEANPAVTELVNRMIGNAS